MSDLDQETIELIAEVRALRERVATLEEGIEAHRRWARQRDASGWMHKGTPHQAPNERLWSLLDVQGDTYRVRFRVEDAPPLAWDVIVDAKDHVQGDTEGR